MIKQNIILFGAGGHARSCVDTIESNAEYNIYGFLGLSEEVGKVQLGYNIIGTDEIIGTLRSSCDFAIVAIGQIQSAEKRIALFELGKKYAFNFPAIIAASANVSPHAVIGEGSIIMPGAVVMPGTKVGKNCIINSRSLLEHDVIIEDHCHISTGAVINGGTTIGQKSFIGSGAVLKEGISLGERCFVGMGSVLTNHLEIGERFLGKSHD